MKYYNTLLKKLKRLAIANLKMCKFFLIFPIDLAQKNIDVKSALVTECAFLLYYKKYCLDLFVNLSCLAGELTQIVKLSSANFTLLYYLDAIDSRRM